MTARLKKLLGATAVSISIALPAASYGSASAGPRLRDREGRYGAFGDRSSK